MVTVSKKIRITDLTNFPVSVGESPTGVPGGPGIPYYYQPYPNYPVGVPSTDTSNISDPITDPHPGSCDAGYVKDSSGYCVPIISLPACPTGQARDPNTGLCVNTTTTPPATTTGIGLLAAATVPPSSVPGETITVAVSIKNTAAVNSYSFGSRVRLASLSIDIFSPLVPVAAGQTVVVSSTIILPATTPVGAVAGSIDVVRQVATTPASVVIDDTEPFTLNIVTNVPYPCSSLPACNTGYHRDSACNCVSDTPVPTPTTAVISTNKATYKKDETITISGSGFKPGETVELRLKFVNPASTSGTGGSTINGPKNVTANSTGGISGTLKAVKDTTTASQGKQRYIQAHGLTSDKYANKNVSIS